MAVHNQISLHNHFVIARVIFVKPVKRDDRKQVRCALRTNTVALVSVTRSIPPRSLPASSAWKMGSDNVSDESNAPLGVLFVGFMVAVIFYGLTFFRKYSPRMNTSDSLLIYSAGLL